VKPIKEPKGRLRYLEPEEEARLLAAAKEPLRTIILTGLHAGLRIHAEALTLRWADVDLKRRLLTVQAAYAKSGQTRTIPMNSALPEAVRERRLRDGAGEFVFHRRDGSPYRDVRTAFENARRRALNMAAHPGSDRTGARSRLFACRGFGGLFLPEPRTDVLIEDKGLSARLLTTLEPFLRLVQGAREFVKRVFV
jgi:integrase